jgi:hypothetical protein
VAIVQISRITARKGLQQDLPEPLASAELGWSVDTRQLYIGNGTTEEGAPSLGNTEILTEYSPILEYTNQYTYQGEAAGYVAQTGASLNSPVTQSLQSRLDSFCVVTDFGAVGDGSTDCTEAINRALYQIYCREVNPQIRRGIFFPAGVYKVSGTLLIPSYAMLYGEGANSSIISFQVETWTSSVYWPYGVLVSNSGSYYRSVNPSGAPIGTSIGSSTYWQLETLPSYIAQTADSLQQSGINIGTNGAIPPTDIEIDSLGFATTVVQTGVLVDSANRVTFRNVNVTGPLTASSLTNATANIIAVDFNSTVSLVTQQVIFDVCAFSGFSWAVNTQEQLQAINFNTCEFSTLYQGLYIGGGSPVNGGPTGVCISQGFFDNIYAEGIVFNTVSLNTSTNNMFYDVGDHFSGINYPATSIISINTANNVSVGDMFQRTAANSTVYPRVNLQGSASYAMTNSEKIEFGTYTRAVGQSMTLADNTADQTVTTIDATMVKAVQINYTVVRNTAIRTGVLTVVAGTDASGTNLQIDNTGIQNSSTGVTFSASETSSIITVKASTSSTGLGASLKYSINYLA